MPFTIAKRLYFSEEKGHRVSRPAVRVAVIGIAVGIAVMLVSLSVVIGFKREVREQVTGFGSHLQVVNFDNNNTFQMKPIVASDSLMMVLRALDNIHSATRFCTKPGIIKTDSAFQGIVIKGREEETFFHQKLIEGDMPEKQNEVVVSSSLCQLLQLHLGDAVHCYFIDDNVRARKYTISGVYETHFSDYDNLFIVTQYAEAQRLNGFDSLEVSGIELLVEDFGLIDQTAEDVYFATANRPDEDGNYHYTQTIEDLNPGIFSWLRLLDMNVIVILILMFAVSGFCIISGLIILILDNIQLIGTMKALGANNRLLRQTFLYESAFLIGKGLLWGNAVGVALCLAQHYLHIVPLDPASYYVAYVPTAITPWVWVVLNVATVMLILLILIAPSAIVAKISPAKVMHFE